MRTTLPPAAAMRNPDSAKQPFLEVCCLHTKNAGTAELLKDLGRAIEAAKRRADGMGFAVPTVFLFSEGALRYCGNIDYSDVKKIADSASGMLPSGMMAAFSVMEKDERGIVNSGYLVSPELWQRTHKYELTPMDKAYIRKHSGLHVKEDARSLSSYKHFESWCERRDSIPEEGVPRAAMETATGKRVDLMICLDVTMIDREEPDRITVVPAYGLSLSKQFKEEIPKKRTAIVINDLKFGGACAFLNQAKIIDARMEEGKRMQYVVLFE